MYFDELATFGRKFHDNQSPEQKVIDILRRGREAEKLNMQRGFGPVDMPFKTSRNTPPVEHFFIFFPYFGLLPINTTLDSLREGDSKILEISSFYLSFRSFLIFSSSSLQL